MTLALMMMFDAGAWFAVAIVAHYDDDRGGVFRCAAISAFFLVLSIVLGASA